MKVPYNRTATPATGDMRAFITQEFQKIETALRAVYALGGDIDMLLGAQDGEFLPVTKGTTTPGVGTYTVQKGRFVKIGRGVIFTLEIAHTAHTGTGNLIVDGLPFPVVGGMSYAMKLLPYGGGMPSTNEAYLDTSNTIQIKLAALAGPQAMVGNNNFMMVGFYFTNA